jgi:dienelactone hydrolase
VKKVVCLLVVLMPLLMGQGGKPWPLLVSAKDAKPLPGTEPLDWEGDLAMRMIDGIDAFLDREIASVMQSRTGAGGTREELARKLGLPLDSRPGENRFIFEGLAWEPYARGPDFSVYQVRWKAFGSVDGVGLLLQPDQGEPIADVIAIPEAAGSPEHLAGIESGKSALKGSYAARMASHGCRVLVPSLINRGQTHKLSTREWLHRPAWELGRTLAGYEVQIILAGLDCLERSAPGGRKTVVIGWGEGGRFALYAAALDERFDGALVSGYFGPRAEVWNETADRNVFGLLCGHSDAEIASLIAPRPLVIGAGCYPTHVIRADSHGVPQRLGRAASWPGKPGRLLSPNLAEVQVEAEKIDRQGGFVEVVSSGIPVEDQWWKKLLAQVKVEVPAREGPAQEVLRANKPRGVITTPILDRQAEQVAEIERHNQWALTDSARVRAELFKGVSYESLEKYEESIGPLREKFSREVIGELASLQELPPPNAKSRAFQEGPKTRSYEVVLDVHEGVFAYGILTVPKDLDLTGGEKRPVVVCQHGLDGRPQDTVGEPGHHYYKAFATRLAEGGFVTFSPQNIYIGHDRFRILQFKANALACTLFSIMVPQHRQITDWLASLPFVDPERIGFYGLSYGGKSAMRIPPLVDRYCLSICSADFNEWIWKNAATDPKSLRYSYANKGEYEIFEFNLGNTFNYYEMAALICPRPFMVERGHFDGVAPDETVAYEYAKVRHLYAAKLGIGGRTGIEWFVGPHTINGVGTFAFLHKHLGWPEPAGDQAR